MNTASYLLANNSENENKAFASASASHGADRSISRRQALKKWRGRKLVDDLATEGITIRSCTLHGVAEEAPGTYKDVDEVAESMEKAGLA